MEPTLTWLDLTSGDRDRMRRVLDLFNEQGTIDEMGLGSLRDTLSDALFPGTSSIQTRLRYMLFLPWMYQDLESRRLGSDQVAQAARKAEISLIDSLMNSEDEGVIGARSRDSLRRLPSAVYWSGLVRWGIFKYQQSQGWYHTNFAKLTNKRGGVGRTDDPGMVWSREPNWHPQLPCAPSSFPKEASFKLTSNEAGFVQGRIVERCNDSLLAWLAQEGSDTPADSFWKDPDVGRAPAGVAELVKLARRFSLHVEGMPLLYNLLLAEQRKKDGDQKVEEYHRELSNWAGREAEEAPFDPNVLWQFVAGRPTRLPHPQQHFVENWTQRISEIDANAVAKDSELRRLIADRERQLKGGRARLVNMARLLDWNGRVGVGRMDFRWFRVKQLLCDLHQGLTA